MQEQLEKLGLSPKEALIYLEILKRGSITAHQLEMITGINRTTVYSVAKSLVEKDLIAEDKGSMKKKFSAEPDALLQLVAEDRQRVEAKSREIGKLLPELNKLALSSVQVLPKIKFVEERNIERYLYEHSAKWNQSMMKYDRIWWGFQDYRLIGHYFEWIKDWWTFPSSKSINPRLFTNESQSESWMAAEGHERRRMKFWQSEEFTGTLWVVGDYVVSVVTAEHPFYMVETYDPVLARNLREVFKQMWKTVV